MAFWGVELKPDKVAPFVPPPEAVDGKLHVSQVGRTMLDVSRVASRASTSHFYQNASAQMKWVKACCWVPSLCSASAVFGPPFMRFSCKRHSDLRAGGWCRRPLLGTPHPAAVQC